jgi:hypothetical protein
MNYELVLTTFGATGVAAVFFWSILNKLNKNVVKDQAESNIYQITKEEITRLATLVKTLSVELEEANTQIKLIKKETDEEKLRCEHELRKVSERLDDLQEQVEHQRRQDELGRNGEIDRRRGVDRRRLEDAV